MKTFLIAFLIGAFTGALTVLVVNERNARTAPRVATTAPEGTTPAPATPAAASQRSVVEETKATISEKLTEWHLTPADLKEELAKGGAIVRSKAQAAGGKISDARIATVVKARYVLDRELSARAIEVDVADGVVTLSGRVGSPELIGRAIGLALESDGVVRVESNLTVE
ncbi:MAG TPA: BON domain-containing protein [Opitutaceae bacterium]